MEWLASWLKSIILIIMLATFVDILLPNQTMQRYVKTVMSLFILLTLLQPVLTLFQKNTSIDRMLADANSVFTGASGASVPALGAQQGGAADMQTLSSIERQAGQLKMRQEQQSQRLVQQQVSDLMKRSIEQATGVKVISLQVEVSNDKQGQAQIQKVFVQAAETPTKPAGAKQNTTGSVKPVTVEPVKRIDITIEPKSEAVFGVNKDKTEDQPNSNKEKTAERGTDTTHAQAQTQIKMLLNKDWELPLDRITVEVAAVSGKDDY